MKFLSWTSFVVILILCYITADKITAEGQHEGSVLKRFKRSLSDASTEREIETLLQEMDAEIESLKEEMRELQVYEQRNMQLVYVFVTFNLSLFIGVKFPLFTLK